MSWSLLRPARSLPLFLTSRALPSLAPGSIKAYSGPPRSPRASQSPRSPKSIKDKERPRLQDLESQQVRLTTTLNKRRKTLESGDEKENPLIDDCSGLFNSKNDSSSPISNHEYSFPPRRPITPGEIRQADLVFGKGGYQLKPKHPDTIDEALQLSLPDVVFLGRGNVGKSTMMNTLLRTRKVVQISSSAGHTKRMAFLSVKDKLNIVDTPGYGHRSQKEWGDFVNQYFSECTRIKRAMLLIDIRRGLLDGDRQVMSILAYHNIPYQIILTKADYMSPFNAKVRRRDIEAWLIRNSPGICIPHILMISAKENKGMDDVRVACLEACGLLKKAK
ncbi:MAG: P-loop containing nucleoside triphosphate hydrolase protein [Piptocephalis tieghemiana]|nr:MAG: P-loop containing nucleoside triphosphate hydrolase protein [Piptocephalis tieghemiana]